MLQDSIAYGTPSCSRVYGQNGHTDQVISCAVSGGKLYTGSLDRKIHAWDINKAGEGEQSAEPEVTYSDHVRGIRCVHTSGAHLYSGAGDGYAKLWDTTTHTVKQNFTGHAAQVRLQSPCTCQQFTCLTRLCDR